MANKQVALAKKLIRIAAANPDRKAELLPKIHMLLGDAPKAASSKLTATQRWDLAEAKAIVANTITAAPAAESINKLPGFAPMQLRQQIDQLGKVRQEIDLLSAQYEAVLKQLKDLEKEEKEGLDALKEAAGQIREKGKYVVEAEKAMIEFVTYLTEKRPGIEQMIAKPEDSKWGDKAGDLFGRVAAKLGAEVAEAVAVIYESTKEDLSHTTMAVKGLKLVTKTSSFDAATLKTAGVADVLISVKEWLSGKAKALFGFAGDIHRWLKGFVERTKLVKDSKENLKDAVKDAMKSMDTILKGAK